MHLIFTFLLVSITVQEEWVDQSRIELHVVIFCQANHNFVSTQKVQRPYSLFQMILWSVPCSRSLLSFPVFFAFVSLSRPFICLFENSLLVQDLLFRFLPINGDKILFIFPCFTLILSSHAHSPLYHQSMLSSPPLSTQILRSLKWRKQRKIWIFEMYNHFIKIKNMKNDCFCPVIIRGKLTTENDWITFIRLQWAPVLWTWTFDSS